jgi:hypothetical protein
MGPQMKNNNDNNKDNMNNNNINKHQKSLIWLISNAQVLYCCQYSVVLYSILYQVCQNSPVHCRLIAHRA